jgi:hypothetical protein
MLFCSEKLLTFSGFTQPDSSMFARVCRTRSIGVLHASTFAGACDRGQRILRSLRLRVRTQALELISNNLANLNTAGYSSSQVDKRKVGKLATAIQVAFQQMGVLPGADGAVRKTHRGAIALTISARSTGSDRDRARSFAYPWVLSYEVAFRDRRPAPSRAVLSSRRKLHRPGSPTHSLAVFLFAE